jgi:hypothetical protein
MFLYFCFGIYYAFAFTGKAPDFERDFGLLPFHIMLALGYGFVTFFSLKHARS